MIRNRAITEVEAQEILRCLNREYKSYTMMVIKPLRKGHAHLRQKWFSLPTWVLNNPFFAVYYIAHEFTHCEGYRGHGDDFKRKEQSILARLGMSIIYKKAYPRYLISGGEIVYKW